MTVSFGRYTFPIDDTPDTILLTRLSDGLILDVNDGFTRNTGYERGEAIGKTSRELEIWVDEQARQRFVQTLRETGECLNFENQFRGKGDRRITALVSAKLTEVDGEPAILSISRNISNIKEFEGKLRHSEQHFRSVVESLGEGVLITDSDDVVLYMNPRISEMTGFSEEDMVGNPAYELLLPSEKWPGLLARNRRRSSGVAERYEIEMLRKDGSLFWAEVHAAPYRDVDGEIVGTLGALIDTTDRKRVEEALRKSEERLRMVADCLGEGLLMTDRNDVILFANPRMAEMTGYELTEMVGGEARELLLSPGDRPAMERRDILRLQGAAEQYELRLRRKDGTLFWAEINATPYRNEKGDIIGTLGAHTDITERKQLQEKLRQSQRMEAVGQLTAGIAHNFNNLLQAIMGSMEVAQLYASDAVRGYLKDAETMSQRGADIVKQLMLFARTGGVVESKPVDIVRVLEDTVAICRRTFDRRISITLKTPRELTLIGDSGQLQQVFLNMCLNARDALEGVIDRDPTIAITAELLGDGGGDRVQVCVVDNGVGISEVGKDQIFEPFFTTKDVGRGTGLGLATAFGIVQQHGGSISCASDVGAGTTFTVQFPIVEQEEIATSLDEGAAAPSGTETVLLIDDEILVRNSLAAYLTHLGYRILTAGDGKEGLKVFGEYVSDIALVVLDLSLPALSGSEVLHALRAIDANARVLIFTGHSSSAQQFEGVVPILQKPVRSKEVARRIRETLDA